MGSSVNDKTQTDIGFMLEVESTGATNGSGKSKLSNVVSVYPN